MRIDGIPLQQFQSLISPNFDESSLGSLINKIIDYIKVLLNRLAHYWHSTHHRWENDSSLSKHLIRNIILNGPAKESILRKAQITMLDSLSSKRTSGHRNVLLQLSDCYKSPSFCTHSLGNLQNPELALLLGLNMTAIQREKLMLNLYTQKELVKGIQLARVVEDIELTADQLWDLCDKARSGLKVHKNHMSPQLASFFEMVINLKTISNEERFALLEHLICFDNAVGLISLCKAPCSQMSEEESLRLGLLLILQDRFCVSSIEEYLDILDLNKDSSRLSLAKAIFKNTFPETVDEFMDKIDLFKLSQESKYELAKYQAKEYKLFDNKKELLFMMKVGHLSEVQIIEMIEDFAIKEVNIWSVYLKILRYNIKLTEAIIFHLLVIYRHSEFAPFTPQFSKELKYDYEHQMDWEWTDNDIPKQKLPGTIPVLE